MPTRESPHGGVIAIQTNPYVSFKQKPIALENKYKIILKRAHFISYYSNNKFVVKNVSMCNNTYIILLLIFMRIPTYK